MVPGEGKLGGSGVAVWRSKQSYIVVYPDPARLRLADSLGRTNTRALKVLGPPSLVIVLGHLMAPTSPSVDQS